MPRPKKVDEIRTRNLRIAAEKRREEENHRTNEWALLKVEKENWEEERKQLKRENEHLKMLLDDGEKLVKFLRDQIQALKQEAREDEEWVRRHRDRAEKAENEAADLRSSYEQHFSHAVEVVKENLQKEKEAEVSPLRERLSNISAFRFKKEYCKLLSRTAREERCRELAEYVKEFAGPSSVDQFLIDFVRFVSESEQFSFSLSLSDWDSFVAAIHWRLSDRFLRSFKAFVTSRLHFDVFGSRAEIANLKKKFAPGVNYAIDIVSGERTTRTGRRIHVRSAVVGIVHLEEVLSRRISALQKSGRLVFDDVTDDEIIVGIAGDKGGEQTKVAMMIANSHTPNDPKGSIVLGFYTGNDDHRTLKERLGSVFKQVSTSNSQRLLSYCFQVNELKSVTYMCNGGYVTKKVRKLVVGDCKYLSALLHHPGQSSKCPCFVCTLPWTTHGANAALVGTFPFENSGDVRSLDELKLQGDVLLDVEPISIAPPALHSLSGVTKSYVLDPLIAHCNQIDSKSQVLPRELKHQRKLLKQRKAGVERYEMRVDALQQSKTMADRASEVLKKFGSTGRGRRSQVEACASSVCLAANAKKSTFSPLHSFVCSRCSKTIHAVCAFQFDDGEVFENAQPTIDCLDCSVGSTISVETRIDLLSHRRDRIAADLEEDSAVLEEFTEMMTELEGCMQKSSGPTRKKFEEALRSFGVDQRVWLQDFCGNHIRKILRAENIEKIVNVFPPSRFISKIRLVMYNLDFLMTNADPAAKSEKEIDEIEQNVNELIRNIKSATPEAVLTPKLHLVACHLVPFLRANRSWGRLTEQAIESLHALFNTFNRRFAAVRDEKLHAQLILQQMACFNAIFDCGMSID
ncbi:unnamed protein product [Caenorhabditis sp. 36 PRJEB53466]|nr:unnamed protein product [Caenorhabditis sp. 36 PRJEB53466]